MRTRSAVIIAVAGTLIAAGVIVAPVLDTGGRHGGEASDPEQTVDVYSPALSDTGGFRDSDTGRRYVARADRTRVSGLVSADEPVVLLSIPIETGRYEITYEFDAVYRSKEGMALGCALSEATTGIPLEPRHLVASVGEMSSVSAHQIVALPAMTIALACSAGETTLAVGEFSGIEMTVTQLD